MTDDSVAACRAALLAACRTKLGIEERLGGREEEYVRVDDAAACMARVLDHVYSNHPSEPQIRGALAAAQAR